MSKPRDLYRLSSSLIQTGNRGLRFQFQQRDHGQASVHPSEIKMKNKLLQIYFLIKISKILEKHCVLRGRKRRIKNREQITVSFMQAHCCTEASQELCEAGFSVPILQMKKQTWNIEEVAQGHVYQQQSRGSNPCRFEYNTIVRHRVFKSF